MRVRILFLVGKSSKDIVLKSEFKIKNALVIEKVKPAFTEKLDFSDLKK